MTGDEPMNFSGITTITFDCYGTLIDWEAGILPVLGGLLRRHGRALSDAAILELYGEFEAEAESGAYQSYREVLQSVVRGFGGHASFDPSPADVTSLYESVPLWPPFSDTVAALQRLAARYRLAIISNIDDDLFAQTRKHLGVEFAAVITAEQARSYKPSLHNFELALNKLEVRPDQLLHVGQSIYHDVLPAQSLGISTVWVNRKSARPGVGAVRQAEGRPDLEVPDLATLAELASSGQ
ncbi:MAG: haloacid dehalogenase type II [Terriglobales bacterium]|jgi:2-haloacid dehalogenase